MLESASDTLPERWHQKWQDMDNTSTDGKTESDLQQWLEQTYSDSQRDEDLSREEIAKVGALVSRLLHFEPSTRASARQILQDLWFGDS